MSSLPPPAPPRRARRILLLEDDLELRMAWSRLASILPDVALETVGTAAEVQIRRAVASYDLVVCDFTLDEGTSEELVRELVRERQPLVVITEEPAVAGFALGDLGVLILRKPLTLLEVLDQA